MCREDDTMCCGLHFNLGSVLRIQPGWLCGADPNGWVWSNKAKSGLVFPTVLGHSVWKFHFFSSLSPLSHSLALAGPLLAFHSLSFLSSPRSPPPPPSWPVAEPAPKACQCVPAAAAVAARPAPTNNVGKLKTFSRLSPAQAEASGGCRGQEAELVGSLSRAILPCTQYVHVRLGAGDWSQGHK